MIVQDDRFNRSNLATVIVLSLTSNRAYGDVPGNIILPKEQSGLSKDSITNATQLAAIDKIGMIQIWAVSPLQISSRSRRPQTPDIAAEAASEDAPCTKIVKIARKQCEPCRFCQSESASLDHQESRQLDGWMEKVIIRKRIK